MFSSVARTLNLLALNEGSTFKALSIASSSVTACVATVNKTTQAPNNNLN